MRCPWPAIAFVLTCGAAAHAAGTAHYRIDAAIDPAAHRITGQGAIKGLDGKTVKFKLAQTIHHPIARAGEDYARGFAETEGTIEDDGVFLSSSAKWYPAPAGGALVTFELSVSLPPGWDAISQGRREVVERDDAGTRLRFACDDPQEEIWLVAGRWTETTRVFDGFAATAFLRQPDEAMAAKYLDATGPYVAMYGKLLGAYPYPRFTLVENFWETGYGMPSFTLLGGKVLRLPFIITTSYPHEILHNWWGNGVYVAAQGGNWSEGLTAYLADHLFAEQKGGGAAYRQETLQKYADYAATSRDFPLTEFRERHSPSTEAVGYGKALMLFHMMRRELGDAAFVKALRALYDEKKFQRASFDDVCRNFGPGCTPWVTRAGAPRLAARGVAARRDDQGRWHVSGELVQRQEAAAFPVAIPIAVTLEGRAEAFQTVIRQTAKSTPFDLTVEARPLRVDVDPEFDLFRALDVEEAPPALSGAFGAGRATMLLPAAAGAEILAAYRGLADEWNTGRTPPMTIVADDAIAELPKEGSLWIVGYENRFAGAAAGALAPYGGDRAVALVARRTKGEAAVIAFVAAPRAVQVSGLARKLPHYHKYSHLAFEGDEPVNVDKGRWPVVDSPMTVFLTPDAPMAALAPREALAELPPAFSQERMVATVSQLAAPELKGRGAGTPELERAAGLIAAAMKDAGLEVLPADREVNNVTGVLRGTNSGFSDSSVVVAAHYDHLGVDAEGAMHPGADDNASGVAVLLELARQLASAGRPSRTIVFVAFTGEEGGRIGSKRYAAGSSAWPAAKAIGMVNLDTVGRLGGGKILVLGCGSADEWIPIVNGAGYVTGAPVEAVMADPGGSDQKSFTDIGVPAVQLFTGPNADYHKPGDTPDKIDGAGLVKVAAVTRELVAYLAERDRPLTSKLSGGAPAEAPAGAPRRAALGSVPDYAFAGPGVRITGTTPGSPAEKAGLLAGDVIVKIGDTDIATLKDFSEALKSKAPGDTAAVTVLREGKRLTFATTLAAR